MTCRCAALLLFCLSLAVSPRADGAAPPRSDGAAPPRADGAAQVTMSASATTVTIGERIELRVVARAAAGTGSMRVQLPPGEYEVLARRVLPAVDTAAGRTFEEIVTIAFFRTGDFTVGPLPVKLLPARGGAPEPPGEETGRLSIRVRSLLGENDRDIKPLKEPLPLRGDPRHLLPYAAAFLLLLAALALLLRRRKKVRRGPAAAAPSPPPDVELEEGLRRLRQGELLRRGEFRAFFIALAALVKRFLARAYGFAAEDCTTAEILALLGKSEADAGIVTGMATVFVQADLVKFARRIPAREDLDALWPALDSLVAVHRGRRERAQETANVQAGR